MYMRSLEFYTPLLVFLNFCLFLFYNPIVNSSNYDIIQLKTEQLSLEGQTGLT